MPQALLRLMLILCLATGWAGGLSVPRAMAQTEAQTGTQTQPAGNALDSALDTILPGKDDAAGEGEDSSGQSAKAGQGGSGTSGSAAADKSKGAPTASAMPPTVPGHNEAALSDADYAEWDKVATRAEDAIQGNRASDQAFEDLRSQLVEWRDRFQREETVNSTAIKAVQAQLDALGPAPEKGATEPEATASQRQQLNDRLSELQEPGKKATVAYSRADSLVQSVDTILRNRQTQALIQLGPSPLDPTNWPQAADDLVTFFGNFAKDTMDAWHNNSQRTVFRQNLPVVLLLLGLSAILLFRGRDWIERLALKVLGTERSASRWLISFIVSLGQIVLPVAGLVMLYSSAEISGLMSPRVANLAKAIPAIGVLLFSARWVGGYIFPSSDQAMVQALVLSGGKRREGRVYANVLGGLMAVYILLARVSDFEGWSQSSLVTLVFPILLVICVFLLRLSRFIIAHAATERTGEEADPGIRNQLVLALGRGVLVVSVLAPVLGAIGYFEAARSLVFPTLLSLLLVGFLVILEKLTEEIYVLITGNRAGVGDALWPVLINFLMVLLSVPVFTLIWGARVTDLAEIWQRFVAGFSIGDTHISPSDFLTFAVIFALGYGATRLLQKTMRTTILPKTSLDVGGRNAALSGIGYIGIFLAAILAITTAGIDLSSLAIVAGALSVGVGFGLQTIVQNFVSGIILLIERPISEGDWIEVSGEMGFVRSISVRSTRIETFDRTDVIVPNADLISGKVTNWTRGNLIGRLIVKVGVAYGTDTRRVEALLREIAEAQPLVLLNPPPGIVFAGFGADSLDFEIRMILRDVTQMIIVQTEINHQIAARFSEEGIEIPFAQRDLWLRNPESLYQRPVTTAPVTPDAATAPTMQDGPAPAFMRDQDPDDGGESGGEGDR